MCAEKRYHGSLDALCDFVIVVAFVSNEGVGNGSLRHRCIELLVLH